MPRVFVGIGSNVEREASIRAGVAGLRERYGEVALSPVYESEAVGFEGDPFYNLVAGFDTGEDIDTVVDALAAIEARNGRRRGGQKFAPRTLDLDLLLYGDAVLRTERYHVPRDEILRYAFVLRPLAELAPDAVHPETGRTFERLWAGFEGQGPALARIDFDWEARA